MLKRRAKYVVLAAAVCYFGFCAVVYFLPQLFFYNPSRRASDLSEAHAGGYPARRVEYAAADGTPLYAWYTAPESSDKVIVFFHGNSYNIEAFYHKLVPLMKAGYGTMLPEYRGFGDIRGVINEKNLATDALAAVRWLNKQGIDNRRIILYGFSLGSFTATNTAYILGKEQPFAALILEVPFTSLLDTVRKLVWFPLPLKYIIKDHYRNDDKIAEIGSPLLIMAGSEDALIPASLAEQLFAVAADPKKIIVYRGAGHNDLFDFDNYRDVLKWLKENEKTRP